MDDPTTDRNSPPSLTIKMENAHKEGLDDVEEEDRTLDPAQSCQAALPAASASTCMDYDEDDDGDPDDDHDEADPEGGDRNSSSQTDVQRHSPANNIQQLKKHMTLDLNLSGSRASRKKARKALLSSCMPVFGHQNNNVTANRSSASLLSTPLFGTGSLWTPTGFVQLESPDLMKCQLPTPELDRFILNNTNINLTPTPSLANPHFSFDKALERMKMKEDANSAAAVAAAMAAVTNGSNHSFTSSNNHINQNSFAAAVANSPLLQFPCLTGVSSEGAAAMAAAAAAIAAGTNSNISPTEESLLAQLIDQTPIDGMELQLKINQLLQRAASIDKGSHSSNGNKNNHRNSNNDGNSNHHSLHVQSTIGLSNLSNSDSNSRPPSNASSSMYAMNLNAGLESCDSNSATGLSNNTGCGSRANSATGNNKGNMQMTAIDFEDQERLKLERKRMRNRIAASKCRKRKLERISKLEDKVKELKDENADLSGIIFKLREHVCQLKAEVMEHVKNGCKINSSHAQS